MLAGKGAKPAQIAEGVKLVGGFQLRQIEEYFQHLRRAGFEERIEHSLFRQLLADIGHPTIPTGH